LAVQITVTGRHVKVTQEVKDYAAQKAEKLLRFYDRVQAIEVILDLEGDNFTVDMIVSSGRNNFIAHEAGPDVFAAVDLIVDKLGRQLKRHKEKFRNRKHLGRDVKKFEGS
jgi:putative sigma-54 modulation protein